MAIRLFSDFRAVRTVVIDVTDDNTHCQDINGEWVEEYESASFYVTSENIDMIISKLTEARKYLSGEPAEISDGFGNTWSSVCPECGKETVRVVTVGEAECRECHK